MSTNERDTHFAGSASSLWLAIRAELRNFLYDEALDARGEETEIAIQQIIARHDYDLVAHSVRHTGVQQYDPATGYESKSIEEVIIRDIPDMRQWPEQSE